MFFVILPYFDTSPVGYPQREASASQQLRHTLQGFIDGGLYFGIFSILPAWMNAFIDLGEK